MPDDFTPSELAERDQWARFVDDELDYAYKLTTSPDFNDEAATTEGHALAERIKQVPVGIQGSLIPIVMARANELRIERDILLDLLKDAIAGAELIGMPYVLNTRLKRIIEGYKNE